MKRPLPLHSQNVWPPFPLVIAFLVIYSVFNAGIWLIHLQSNLMAKEMSNALDRESIHGAILGSAAVAYALYRLGRFHPACNRAYSAWLKSSPWSSDRPLPAGPVHLVWQDAVAVGSLVALAIWPGRVYAFAPLIAFALAYLIGLTCILAVTRTWPCFLAASFIWPGFLLLVRAPWLSTALGAILILVIWRGTRRSFQTFPWPAWASANRLGLSGGRSELPDFRFDGAVSDPMRLGWPYFTLSPKFKPRSMTVSASLAISALVGWWLYCFIKCFQAEPMPAGMVLFLAIVAACARVVIYCMGVVPPFNVWGRMASRRFILPGFDKVFLTPVAVVAVGVLGGMLIQHSGSWYPSADCLVVAILLLVSFEGRPSLRDWMLTGQVRFHPSFTQRSNRQPLRRV